MALVDLDALNNANKGLVVIFIISIFIINCLLIFKTVKRGGFLYNAKSLTVISLAIGDIFLALFALVIYARYYYESRTFHLPCNTDTAFRVYLYYLIHFVYGVGLIVLAVELVYRHKGQPPVGNTTTNIMKSVVFSAVPWILGLIIVLPVTMAGTLFQGCLAITEPSRQKSVFVVSVLLPASLAVIICVAVMCIRLEPTLFTSQAASYQGTTPGVVIATHNTINGPQQYHMTGVVGTQQMSTAPPATYYNQVDNQNLKLGGPEVTAPNTQFLPLQYPVHQQTSQSNLVITAPVYSVQPQNTTNPAIQDPGREKNVLLIVSIIYLLCVTPFAAYCIYTVDNLSQALPSSVDKAVSAALLWLSLLRSIITPAVWMVCSRN